VRQRCRRLNIADEILTSFEVDLVASKNGETGGVRGLCLEPHDLLDQTQIDQQLRSRIRDQITRDFHAERGLEERQLRSNRRRLARLMTRRLSRCVEGRSG
jgi:hypothetical protein